MNNIHKANLEYYLNGELMHTHQVHPELTALQLLRNQGLTASKESCSEGDCGSCTIAVGILANDKVTYHALTSCILPAIKLHGTHVITAEGLSPSGTIHLIQQMLVDNHAVQCGYCTPGIIMSLFCLLANNPKPTQEEIYAALEGNLCRCTGYIAINEATLKIIAKLSNNKNNKIILPDFCSAMARKLAAIKPITYQTCAASELDTTQSYYAPTDLKQLFTLMTKLKPFKLINGGTDVMVAANINQILATNLIDLAKIKELHIIKIKNNKLIIGGNVTYNQVLNNSIIGKKLPILCAAIPRIASQQIRNIATIAGNIANASPIADSACILLSLDARLILQSKNSTRIVTLANFYHGYKKINLQKNEIIKYIEIDLTPGKHKFIKSAKRNAVDIATVNSAINIDIAAEKVNKCRIAFGGVAPFPMLATKCSEFLCGKKITAPIIKQAAQIAAQEFTPISDVRGSKKMREFLIKNHITDHLQEFCDV